MKRLKLGASRLEAVAAEAAKVLKAGGVVLSPTDTVYGLLSDATNPGAVKKVYAIKQRNAKKPLPFFVKNMRSAKKLAMIGKKEEKILTAAWPGKTTFVLELKPDAVIFGSGNGTIALRIPCLPFLDTVLGLVGFPLSATSANRAGQPASTNINDVLKQFDSTALPDLVIDAGILPESKPSTIIDLAGKSKKILRHG